jgi:uncharacterized protein (TIGR02453 family)
MSYFTQEFNDFFEQLVLNNQREWFHSHKTDFEKHVKKPFENLVGEIIASIREDDPEMQIEPKEAIFRIHKDVRFSKDKSPYKTHVSAAINQGGRKDMQNPGIYFQLGAEGVMIAGGIYMPNKEAITHIRRMIQVNMDEFQQILEAEDFKSLYGTLRGEQNKIIPKEFKEDVINQPLLANKQFYYMVEYKDVHEILRPDLPDWLMKHYFAGKKMNLFLKEALS